MKVIFHEDFYSVYTSDPAAAAGRIEPIVSAITAQAEFIAAQPASEDELRLAHTINHIDYVKAEGLYDIASLAAGGATHAQANQLRRLSASLDGDPATGNTPPVAVHP